MWKQFRALSSAAAQAAVRKKVEAVPSLAEFLQRGTAAPPEAALPPEAEPRVQHGRKVHLETYGCQMNVSDSEIVASILQTAGYNFVKSAAEADYVLLNTCSIRENAETKIWSRLRELRGQAKARRASQKLGILGCMAERLKSRLLDEDKLVDVVCGPDAYRDLPNLMDEVEVSPHAINVQLSLEETYADISPVRTASNNISAFVSIMRGCNNMCTYCIVPFTRGRERSRAVSSIEEEVRNLSDQGFKEVILLGQNVNSFQDLSAPGALGHTPPKGFKSLCKPPEGGLRFVDLLDRVSRVNPEMRFRFTSPHPKDFPIELLQLIKERPNICKNIHIPAQSGSSAVLTRMRRNYTRESYLSLISVIKETIPDVTLSSDFISGFCGETEEDHLDTLSLMRTVKYDHAFMFAYSMRERTHAHYKLQDDVPHDVKIRRLEEVIAVFHEHALANNKKNIGRVHLVLVEGTSKRSDQDLLGRTDTNIKVIFPSSRVPPSLASVHNAHPSAHLSPLPGDYVAVKITSATSATLKGVPLALTTAADFHASPAVLASL